MLFFGIKEIGGDNQSVLLHLDVLQLLMMDQLAIRMQ